MILHEQYMNGVDMPIVPQKARARHERLVVQTAHDAGEQIICIEAVVALRFEKNREGERKRALERQRHALARESESYDLAESLAASPRLTGLT